MSLVSIVGRKAKGTNDRRLDSLSGIDPAESCNWNHGYINLQKRRQKKLINSNQGPERQLDLQNIKRGSRVQVVLRLTRGS